MVKEKPAKQKTAKTNAIRLLDSKKIKYVLREYEAPDGFLSGIEVAHATGMPIEKVFKTLVTVGASKEHYVCVIPVAEELNLKKAAKHFDEKKLEMLPSRELTSLTGYIKGGCSPVGMKKPLKTAIDLHALNEEVSGSERTGSIIVSGGKVGLQMELALKDLMSIAAADLADLTGN